MVWSQLDIEKPHVAYACIGIFTTIFSLVSLFVKEKLYIGEATVAAVTGLILGPHCLGWFNPLSWGNSDYITLEISRIVLCVQIFAVAVELPKKYMLKHWLSVFILLVPVMTCGWLIVGLFIWILIPGLNFAESLLVSACVTATDPVLASAVVGKGKFAERVPGHLRNILSAESGCNDGMAFPFIYLSLDLVIHKGHAGEIIKDWIVVTILWECIFGCILGAVIGYLGRHAISFAESRKLIDRESFLAFYIVLAFTCAGVGSMLGVDDLLVSFAAGAAFAWNGWFAKKTEETHVSTVIDLLLNLAYFVYFGAIIPWEQFNNHSLGLDAWRLVILAFVIIFLRRIPAVLALKPITPDIKTWREALFCGHFGPIGVGAVFAAILARRSLEATITTGETPLEELPLPGTKHYQLITAIWPIVTFLIITSIVVHGSSVAVMTLGRHLNAMSITMSFSQTQGNQNSTSWMSRLSKLETSGRTFSLHRIDTENAQSGDRLPKSNTVETSGVPVRPAGGMKRRKGKMKKHKSERSRPKNELIDLGASKKPEPVSLQLGKAEGSDIEENDSLPTATEKQSESRESGRDVSETSSKVKTDSNGSSDDNVPVTAYGEGDLIFLENRSGEIVDTIEARAPKKEKTPPTDEFDQGSIHSLSSLRRKLSKFSVNSSGSDASSFFDRISTDRRRPSFVGEGKVFLNSGTRKDDPTHKKLFAFKLNDQIIIENAEGEIVRRYRVNHHGTSNRARSSSVISGMNKALSFVGLKAKDQNPSNTAMPANSSANIIDVERNDKSNADLIPEFDNLTTTPGVEKQLEKRLKTMLGTNGPKVHDTVLEADEDELEEPENQHASSFDKMKKVNRNEGEINENDEDEDDDGENSGEEDDDEDEVDESDEAEESEKETDVERIRRLAALGEYHAPRHSDDEEE